MKYVNFDNLLLILLLLLSLILFFSNNSPQVHRVKGELSDVVEILMYPQNWYENIFSVKEENKLLIEKVAILNLLNIELGVYEQENQYLKGLLNFSNDSPHSMSLAKVVNQHLSVFSRTIILDIGSNQNISANMPVIDMNGLLGKTIDIGDGACQVQLINDNNFRVSIRVGKEMVLGIFVPTHGKYGILDGIRKTSSIIENDIVYTSGISKIFPENIPVAIVTHVNKENNRAFQDVVVEVLADMHNYNYVFLIH